MIQGIAPILFTPFDENGDIDAESLRKIVRFELDGGVHAIGINGFASEAYKMKDDERLENVAIAANEMADAVPLIIGIAPNSTEAAILQSRQLSQFQPAALMALPPPTMDNGDQSLVDFYVELGEASDAPIIVQQAPHIPQYRHTELPAEALAEIADRAPNVQYFKIEGPGSADKMAELAPLLGDDKRMFGGGGGITVLNELRNGAAGLIPGAGFNEIFLAAWDRWTTGDDAATAGVIERWQCLDQSCLRQSGHEYSLHMRKQLMKR